MFLIPCSMKSRIGNNYSRKAGMNLQSDIVTLRLADCCFIIGITWATHILISRLGQGLIGPILYISLIHNCCCCCRCCRCIKLTEDKNDLRMGCNLFLWALDFENIKFQPLIGLAFTLLSKVKTSLFCYKTTVNGGLIYIPSCQCPSIKKNIWLIPTTHFQSVTCLLYVLQNQCNVSAYQHHMFSHEKHTTFRDVTVRSMKLVTFRVQLLM